MRNFIVYPLIALTLAAGVFIRVGNLDFDKKDTSIRTPDEAIYTAYASVLAHTGVQGTAISVREYNLNPKLWLLPPPTRVGYLYLLAAVMKVTGRHDLDLGIDVSCAISVLSLVLICIFCIRFLSPWVALYACIFMCVSPMELAFARKVWQDGFMTFLGGLLVFLSFEILRRKNKIIPILIFGLIGSITMLVKESGAVIFAICGAFLMVRFTKERLWKMFICLTVTILAAVVLSLAIAVWLSGGWTPFIELYQHLRFAVSSNEYAVQMQNGAWHSLVSALFMLTPVTASLCAWGIFKVFRHGKERASEGFFLTLLFISFLVATSAPAYFKNLRYLSPVFIPYYVLAALAFDSIAQWLRQTLKSQTVSCALIIFFLGITAGLDLYNFEIAFRQRHVKDLVNPLLSENVIYIRTRSQRDRLANS